MGMSGLKNTAIKHLPFLYKPYVAATVKMMPLTSEMQRFYFKHFCRSPKKLMVNVGGGPFLEKGWSVLDFQCEHYQHKRKYIDFWYDLTSFEKMPFSDDSVYLFYSEHTFEHISDRPCWFVFSEVYRCLKPGGAFRIVVPDMDLAYEKFGSQDTDFFKLWMEEDNATFTEAFIILFAHPIGKANEDEVRYNYANMKKEEFFDYYAKPLKQNPKTAGHHVNWFNFLKLKRMLDKAGFGEVYETGAQMSRFRRCKAKNLIHAPGGRYM